MSDYVNVVFKQEHQEGGRTYKSGQLVRMAKDEARKLEADGVVEVRADPGPTEYKGDDEPPEQA